MFSRLVSKVIAALAKILENSFIRAVIQVYIDDIVIASRDINSSLRALLELLKQLRASGLTLKLSSAYFSSDAGTALSLQDVIRNCERLAEEP